MAEAYILINCEIGSEEQVITALKTIDGIKEVHGTFGAYDILAKIESAQVEDLRETITWKIRKIDKIPIYGVKFFEGSNKYCEITKDNA